MVVDLDEYINNQQNAKKVPLTTHANQSMLNLPMDYCCIYAPTTLLFFVFKRNYYLE
jgi:hypothetical protein